VRVEQENLAASIETIGGVPLYRLRGNLLPLVDLGAELGVAPPKLGRDASDSAANIVVLQADGVTFGMLVDEINDTEEIVVKPLGKQLKGLSCYAGATIMGDGKVALILDVAGVAARGGVAGAKAQARRGKHAESEDAAEAEKHALLLFRVGEDRRVGIPLSAVARLEEFPRSALEQGGGRRVVQYRGEILPLCSVAEALGAYDAGPQDGPMQVVVYSNKGRSIGLVVERILDIVAESYASKPSGGGALKGVAVIQGKVTDILDVEALARSLDPDHAMSGLEPAGSI
ncbi:MAG: hypothetical protein RL112_1437, partial [Planctomycetota bacterium]